MVIHNTLTSHYTVFSKIIKHNYVVDTLRKFCLMPFTNQSSIRNIGFFLKHFQQMKLKTKVDRGGEVFYYYFQWLFAFSMYPVSPFLPLFVQKSSLADAFSIDKTLWEEYEKADLKVTAGQRGYREREPGYHSYVLHIKSCHPFSPFAEMNKRWNTVVKQSHSKKGLVPTKRNEGMKRHERLQGNIRCLSLRLYSYLYSYLRHIYKIWGEHLNLSQRNLQTWCVCDLKYNLLNFFMEQKSVHFVLVAN